VFFKFMVKRLAELNGLRATFMPKPFMHLTGNGCHAHVSLWNAGGSKNLFLDPKGELGLSPLAYQFLGGILHNAEALCALFTPTVNSFKRINAAPTLSGATWSPNSITYAGNNRTHMVRIPEPGRFELRLIDGAANPYLLQAGILAGGLDGIAEQRDPGKRLDVDMYAIGHTLKGIRKLPLNLLDALRAFEGSCILRTALGAPFLDSYVKLRTAEWHDYTRHLTDWERTHTLDA
jgi:glutamine synthetase